MTWMAAKIPYEDDEVLDRDAEQEDRGDDATVWPGGQKWQVAPESREPYCMTRARVPGNSTGVLLVEAPRGVVASDGPGWRINGTERPSTRAPTPSVE
jgi:hypothetical protein